MHSARSSSSYWIVERRCGDTVETPWRHRGDKAYREKRVWLKSTICTVLPLPPHTGAVDLHGILLLFALPSSVTALPPRSSSLPHICPFKASFCCYRSWGYLREGLPSLYSCAPHLVHRPGSGDLIEPVFGRVQLRCFLTWAAHFTVNFRPSLMAFIHYLRFFPALRSAVLHRAFSSRVNSNLIHETKQN